MKKIFDKVNETGTMLVEAMAMLGLIAMVTPILYKKAAERTTELQDINASNQLRVLADAMDAYIKDNFTRITDGEKVVNGCNVNTVDYAAFTDDTSVRFDISHLCEYLPYGFLKDGKTQDSKLFSSSETNNNSFQVVLRKTTGTETDEEGNETIVAETVTGFLTAVPNEGDDFPSTRVARIATMVGSNGGYKDANGEIMGAQGIWSLTSDTELGDVTLPENSFVVSSLQPISSQGLANEDVLHRKDEPQNDHLLNSMETDLFMAYNDKIHNIRQVNQIIMTPQLEWMVGGEANQVDERLAETTVLEAIPYEQTYEPNLDYTLYIGSGGGAFMEGNFAALASLFTVRSEEDATENDGGIKYYETATHEDNSDPNNPVTTTVRGNAIYSVTTGKMEYGNIDEETAGALLTVDKDNTSMEFVSKTEGETVNAEGETETGIVGTQKMLAINASRANIFDGALSVRNPKTDPDGGKYDENDINQWVTSNATPAVIVGGGDAHKGSYTTYSYNADGTPKIENGEFESTDIADSDTGNEHALTVNGPAFVKDSLKTAKLKAYNVDAATLRAGVVPEDFDTVTKDEEFYVVTKKRGSVTDDTGAVTDSGNGYLLVGPYTDAFSNKGYRLQIAEQDDTSDDGTEIQEGIRMNHESGVNILVDTEVGDTDGNHVGLLEYTPGVSVADSGMGAYATISNNTAAGQVKIGAATGISLSTMLSDGTFITDGMVSIQDNMLRAYYSDYSGVEGAYLDSVADNSRFISQHFADNITTSSTDAAADYPHDYLYRRDVDDNGIFGLGGMDLTISEPVLDSDDQARPVMDIKAKREEGYISSRFAGGFAIYDYDVVSSADTAVDEYPSNPSVSADATDADGNALRVGMGNPSLYVNKGDFQILATEASTTTTLAAGDIILQVDNNETHDAVTTTNDDSTTTTTDERGSVYIRRGAINIDSASGGRLSNKTISEGYDTTTEAIGYIAADRFISQVVPSVGALNKTHASPGEGATILGTDNAAIVPYDKFEVNPAYTSVMNDIKLTTRGGARLSDILPDFINKGIYVVDNTYPDNTPWTDETKDPATFTELTGESVSSESYTSAYLGFVPTPVCPQGYSKVITINPSGWSMAQAGTPVTKNSAIDIATHNNPYLYWYTVNGEKRTEAEEVEPVNPLTFQKSTWLRAMVLPNCGGLQTNGKCDEVTTFNGWGTVMGFIYPRNYYADFISGMVGTTNAAGEHGSANTGSSGNMEVGEDGSVSANTIYWNLYPVQYRQLEAYVTVYCYFNRKAGWEPTYVDTGYDQLESPRSFWDKSGATNIGNLNDPKLKYNDPW